MLNVHIRQYLEEEKMPIGRNISYILGTFNAIIPGDIRLKKKLRKLFELPSELNYLYLIICHRKSIPEYFNIFKCYHTGYVSAKKM